MTGRLSRRVGWSLIGGICLAVCCTASIAWLGSRILLLREIDMDQQCPLAPARPLKFEQRGLRSGSYREDQG